MVRALLASLLAVPLLVGCSVGPERCAPHAPTAVVPTLPPAPLPETITAPPAPGMTHVDGYWHWDGLRWVWIPGHWLTPPPGQRWSPAYTAHEGGHVVFHPGEMTCAPRSEDDDP